MGFQGKSNIPTRPSAVAALAWITAVAILGGYHFLPMAPELKAASHDAASLSEDTGDSGTERPAAKPDAAEDTAKDTAEDPAVKKAGAMEDSGNKAKKDTLPWWKKDRRRSASSEPPDPAAKIETGPVPPPAAALNPEQPTTETDPVPPPAAALNPEPPPSTETDPLPPPTAVLKPDPPPGKKADFVPPAPKKIEWGIGFKSWPAVSGFVSTRYHGNRIVQTFISTAAAAEIFNQNARNARMRNKEGFQRFPPGTVIVQQSWARNKLGGAGEDGPLFLMRKEPSGYDRENGDWQYVLASKKFNIIGGGRSAQVVPCKQCHGSVKNRDFVFGAKY